MLIWKGIPVVAIAAACLNAQPAAKPKELTARELFYVAAEGPKAAPQKLPAAKAAPAKPPAKAPVQVAVKPPRPAPTLTPGTPAVGAPVRTAPPTTPASPDGTAIITASAPMRRTAPAPASGPPLGLRYTITKLIDGQMTEVSPDTVFRSGDRIKITISTNVPGYLYIVNQGSSGTWKPIFPSPEVEDGNNRVDGFRDYAMPPKSRIVFDSQAGTEKLFVILSREPEPDFEQLIYSLQAPRTTPTAAPPSETPAKAPTRTMIAANISNDLVGRMRNVYARDLVIEKVDDDAPSAGGGKREKAVYVVNPSGSADSRVVADISLVHQ
jgi:hypothetical protein